MVLMRKQRSQIVHGAIRRRNLLLFAGRQIQRVFGAQLPGVGIGGDRNLLGSRSGKRTATRRCESRRRSRASAAVTGVPFTKVPLRLSRSFQLAAVAGPREDAMLARDAVVFQIEVVRAHAGRSNRSPSGSAMVDPFSGPRIATSLGSISVHLPII